VSAIGPPAPSKVSSGSPQLILCLVRPVSRSAIRRVILSVAIIIALLSLLDIAGGWRQIAKNRSVLADMEARVSAIKEFQRAEGRLPSETELAGISERLPTRYFGYDYQLDTRPGGRVDSGYPTGWPASGGWVLWFWRGEWAEYYSSWDGHYTLRDQLSWWAFCWPSVIALAAAVALVS
jgi:hypothetical protein